MAGDGYCRNGVHHIGDADTCPRCDWYRAMRFRGQIVRAATQARLLAAASEGE